MMDNFTFLSFSSIRLNLKPSADLGITCDGSKFTFNALESYPGHK